MPDQDTDPVLQKLPPEKLLAADRLEPIRAGIRCMDSIETIQQYLAHENANRDRTQVQAALRMRARELRDAEVDDETETTPIL
jgi:predicted hydrolase (HD superfamily)